MRRTKSFLIVSFVILIHSMWVDSVSAQEASQSTPTQQGQKTLVEQANSLADSLDERFVYYYQHLSLVTNSLDEQVRDTPQEQEALEHLNQVRQYLELGKKQGEASVDYLSQLDTSDTPQTNISLSRETALSARAEFKKAILELRAVINLISDEN